MLARFGRTLLVCSSARLLVCSLLAGPFLLVGSALGALVEPLARGVAQSLVDLSLPLRAPVAGAAPAAEAAPLGAELGLAAAPQPNSRRSSPVAAPARSKPQALFVAASTVLKLADSAACPRGSFVPATDRHPAGLRLTGVSSLGIGLQEGDILIDALGISPQSSSEIIGAILQARANQARYLSGTLWRQGQTFRITVEQPYLRQG